MWVPNPTEGYSVESSLTLHSKTVICMKKIENGNLVTKKEVLHAESNAISKCAKWLSSTEDATLYVTLSPCFECAKIIIQAGIKRVCYNETYRNTEGLDFLKKNGIQVDQIFI